MHSRFERPARNKPARTSAFSTFQSEPAHHELPLQDNNRRRPLSVCEGTTCNSFPFIPTAALSGVVDKHSWQSGFPIPQRKAPYRRIMSAVVVLGQFGIISETRPEGGNPDERTDTDLCRRGPQTAKKTYSHILTPNTCNM